MAHENYDEALRRLLAHEGGYSNNPSDPGGPTNFGITIADYRRYVNSAGTAADVRAMPLADAKAIYRSKYWDALRGDALPAGLDYAVFDYGVNSGTVRPATVLQRLLGLHADGRMSDAVVEAACRRDAGKLVAQLCDERLVFLKGLKTWPVFGTGWRRRVTEVKTVALTMAKPAAVTAPEPRQTTPIQTGRAEAAAGILAAAGTAIAQLMHRWRAWRSYR